jgi:type IV pilus assembly protein PilA
MPAAADFKEASAHIDLDGSMLAYIDFEGDGQEIGTALNNIYQQALTATPEIPPIPVDFNLLLENLGFGSLQALAMSSKEVELNRHHNRSVALMKDAPSGLFALYDLAPLTFTAAQLAPSDATGAMTVSVNLDAVTQTASAIMQQVMGPMGDGIIQQQLTQVIPGTEISYGETITALSGEWNAFWLQSYSENFQETFKFWISIEDAGKLLPKFRSMAEAMGAAFIEDDTTLKANFSQLLDSEAPFGLYAEANKQTGDLVLYSHPDWTSSSSGPRLVDNETFKNLAAQLPSTGVAFNYNFGSDLSPILAELSSIPEAAAYIQVSESIIDLLIGDFLKPSMTVTHMVDNNLLTEQYAGYSTKQALMVIPSVVAGGIGAAMAIPAFQKVRANSREKAVTNNLRQIAAAADQYCLENGVTEVHIDQLLGENGYIKKLTPIAGENYDDMIIRPGETISVILEDGSEVSVKF